MEEIGWIVVLGVLASLAAVLAAEMLFRRSRRQPWETVRREAEAVARERAARMKREAHVDLLYRQAEREMIAAQEERRASEAGRKPGWPRGRNMRQVMAELREANV